MKFTSEIRTDDFFADDIPEEVTFEIDKELANRIRELAEVVKANNLYKVVFFDYRAEWGTQTDCDQLNVSEDEFWFSTYLKHTCIELFTERYKITDLEPVS